MTLEALQVSAARAVNQELGTNIDIVFTAQTEFTIVGSIDDVQKAAHYFYTHNLAEMDAHTPPVYSEDLGGYAYMVTK